jgi:hypothetical protein
MALPEVTERLSHGTPTWFVRDKKTFVQIWPNGHHGDTYPHLTVAQAQADPQLIPRLVKSARVGAWAHGYLTGTGWIEWLAGLPLELRTALPDGTRLLGVHAAPGRDDGPGAGPDTTEDELRAMMSGCGAALVCLGHTHQPWEGRVRLPEGEVHIVNVGAVTRSRADYALLEAGTDGYHITLHRVAYDTEAVRRAMVRHYLPQPGPIR